MTKICFCIKSFRSIQYILPKIFCLKLPDVLVNSGKISTGQNRNLSGNLHYPALILTPEMYYLRIMIIGIGQINSLTSLVNAFFNLIKMFTATGKISFLLNLLNLILMKCVFLMKVVFFAKTNSCKNKK